MSAPFTIAFDAESRALIGRMQSAPQDMLAAIARGMDKGLAVALGDISRKRFTGTGPKNAPAFPVSEHRLFARSNTLRKSLRWNVTGLPGDDSSGKPSQVTGATVSGQVGTNIKYAGVHEYGFDGEVGVRSFRRRVSASQFVIKGGSILPGSRKNKGQREAALGMEQVRAHRRRMHIPARAPLGTGLRENSGTIVAEIAAKLRAAWTKRGTR